MGFWDGDHSPNDYDQPERPNKCADAYEREFGHPPTGEITEADWFEYEYNLQERRKLPW